MSEQEWLACTEPSSMLPVLRRLDRASERKCRLFAVACCRRVSHLLTDDRNREAIEVAESYADGLIAKKSLKAARRKTFRVRAEGPCLIGEDYRWGAGYAEDATVGLTLGPYEAAADTAKDAAIAVAYGINGTSAARRHPQFQANRSDEEFAQACLLRDIFGNPFRPMTVDSVWLSSNVVALAQTIYSEKSFECLPILADALEESGCSNSDILNHCRSNGTHVRGCWVIDLLLGKE